MTDGNTQAIAQYLDKRDEWDALQEVTVELEQAESDNILLIARIEELEAELEYLSLIHI
jgi:BMFP domain-containing protein YqiC